MEELNRQLDRNISPDMQRLICSNPRNAHGLSKVTVRPILLRDEVMYQATEAMGKQVFHENLTKEELIGRVLDWMETQFKQLELSTKQCRLTCLIGKKGTCSVKCKLLKFEDGQIPDQPLEHNRSKNYILSPDEPVGFLIDLGVQTPDGVIKKSAMDKFRQINRFLEFIEDVLPKLRGEAPIKIIDFGCGKSYLTFAVYHYLHNICGLSISVIGLDLKEDVIRKCNHLRDKYGYDGLNFICGDIKDFDETDCVDMVMTLHACDTATDYALEKAVRWGAKVILAVPCCQHELNGKISCELLQPALKYGIIKERLSALLTDAIRAELLEQQGYDTQILEFIDMSHTPKNLLIRAVKREGVRMRTKSDAGRVRDGALCDMTEFLGVKSTLQELWENSCDAD